jgi:hypothetical protein
LKQEELMSVETMTAGTVESATQLRARKRFGVEFVGAPPPPHMRRGARPLWQDRLLLAKERPGQWARIAVKAVSMAGMSICARNAAKKLGGSWEVTTRGNPNARTPGPCFIYFRYIEQQ